jgi:hypothetical protein
MWMLPVNKARARMCVRVRKCGGFGTVRRARVSRQELPETDLFSEVVSDFVTHDAVWKARVVLDVCRGGELPARLERQSAKSTNNQSMLDRGLAIMVMMTARATAQCHIVRDGIRRRNHVYTKANVVHTHRRRT